MFQCPICKSPVSESMLDQPKSTFPFCSDRCRLIDLGRWIDGKYQIPVEDDNESYRSDSSEGFGSGGDEETPRH